jgi:hypothetical protein
MTERRDVCEQTRLDGLCMRKARELRWTVGVDERLDRLEAGSERRLDEVFALTTEQPQPFTLASPVQAPDEA